ncbi:pyridoxamine 5'-phosphate oxidase family protein [Pedobacter frigiditerrae]|uniref:Pyridoxamine 5'-phosphate oxidase family protein n=1 Tax=Pedobacter frigiditerrae TaxID=2530452 RepID=A0A4R0MT04_9SPHI|nr:pyridoxamine 5'-phosphate oxidase family protein [Pedobacter frigiditerrae]TCC90148.1 pyridoxamine 5'-phosphate oxidase family protein [Pedobacter frigiditerrae]
MNYPEIAFTKEVKTLQEKFGSRAAYARMADSRTTDGLSEEEIDFITQQDYFYLSTISESGYPYIQFRGGPKGFLKVIDHTTLGFIDFEGNKQYISAGNIKTNNKAALFFLDQASRTRLKMFAEVEVVSLAERPDLLEKLSLADYQYKPKFIMLFKVQGYDWNCPQHITPRYTQEEIQEAFKGHLEESERLKEANERLRREIADLGGGSRES